MWIHLTINFPKYKYRLCTYQSVGKVSPPCQIPPIVGNLWDQHPEKKKQSLGSDSEDMVSTWHEPGSGFVHCEATVFRMQVMHPALIWQ